jgi:hypothetical protein
MLFIDIEDFCFNGTNHVESQIMAPQMKKECLITGTGALLRRT